MSAHTWWAIDTLAADPAISRPERTVLLVLAGHARAATGECWPAEETIAAVAGICAGNVRRALSKLAARGLVEVTRRSGRTNLYRLAAPIPLSTTPRDSARGTADLPRAIATRTPRDSDANPARYRAPNIRSNEQPADEAAGCPIVPAAIGRAYAERLADEERARRAL